MLNGHPVYVRNRVHNFVYNRVLFQRHSIVLTEAAQIEYLHAVIFCFRFISLDVVDVGK